MQRAPEPWQFKTPNRVLEDQVKVETGADDLQQSSVMSSGSKVSKKEISASQPLPANYVRRVRSRAAANRGGPKHHVLQIADLTHLAESAMRSGNLYQALQAFHKMGVVLDNQGMHEEALKKYKRLLSLCITSKNTQGEALAYNCLGINTFKLGQYDESIQYHNKHLELADQTGRLIAHTNLGIVFHAMGLAEHAAIHHQHAIEYANRMGSKEAQCFTVGNLGVASAAQGDLQTSRICLQYHLTAAERQKQNLGSNKFATHTLKEVGHSAYHRLGQINTTDGRFDEAANHFTRALDLAKSKGDLQSEQTSSAMIGIAKGLQTFDQHCAALVASAANGGDGGGNAEVDAS
jgi:tetratricopeptide (TPR) repeat protein